MFNEMYGWDSYFIIRGLIDDGRMDLARDIVDNFFFEIDHYGGVLNANRTYYLTRSQPPFLTSMIRAVYEAEKAQGQAGSRLACPRLPLGASRIIDFWTSPPHLAGATGLSRYYGWATGRFRNSGINRTEYYRQVVHYFLLHPANSHPLLDASRDPDARERVMGPEFSLVLDEAGRRRGGEDIEKWP